MLDPKEDYAKHYLHSDHWKDFSARFIAVPANQQCCICGATADLEINHLTYERRGAELLTDAVRMCHYHHIEVFHVILRARNWCVCLPHSTAVVAEMRLALQATKRREHVVFVASHLGNPPTPLTGRGNVVHLAPTGEQVFNGVAGPKIQLTVAALDRGGLDDGCP